jgi:hypothetical protein
MLPDSLQYHGTNPGTAQHESTNHIRQGTAATIPGLGTRPAGAWEGFSLVMCSNVAHGDDWKFPQEVLE